ncbi:hypothetical protein AB834_06335 [PVC group bacterium (ex Bugula neritina AB1)]|nr:hypothetical protein AB834_06335 [PVC group bacterium (ex Bugula neritina AB1)]
MKKIIFLTLVTFCFFNFFSDKNINSLGVSSLSNLSKNSFDSQKEDPPVNLNAPDVEYVKVAIHLNGTKPWMPDRFSYRLLEKKILKEDSRRLFEDFISSNIERSFGVIDESYNGSLRAVKKPYDGEHTRKLGRGRGVLDMRDTNRPFERISSKYTNLERLVYIHSSPSMRDVSLTYVFVRGADFDFSLINKSDRTVYINMDDYLNLKETLNREKENQAWSEEKNKAWFKETQALLEEETKKLFEASFTKIVNSLNKDFEEEDYKGKIEKLAIEAEKRIKDEKIRKLPDNCGPFVVATRDRFTEFKFMEVKIKSGGFKVEEESSGKISYDEDLEAIRMTIGDILRSFSYNNAFGEKLRKAENKEITIYVTEGFHQGNASTPAGAPAFVDFSDGKYKLKISKDILCNRACKPFLKWILYWELLRIVSPKQKENHEKFLEVAAAHGETMALFLSIKTLEERKDHPEGYSYSTLLPRKSWSIFEEYMIDREAIKEQDVKNWLNGQETYRSA